MKTFRILIILFLSLLPIQGEDGMQQQNYTGTYQVNTGDNTLTLTIKQEGFNNRDPI